MVFFYMDESGTGLGDKHTPFFVLAALAVPIEARAAVDSAVTALKRRLAPWAKPEDFEIKGRDLQRGDRFFRGQDWRARAQAMIEVAGLVAELPCRVFAVQVDKRHLTEFVASDEHLYRLAFWRLLDQLESELAAEDRRGMLLVDMRSDMHSSVQDRRLLDSFADWSRTRGEPTHFAESPWFGFSAFYAGLQLADFAAYVIDVVHNERSTEDRANVLRGAFEVFAHKLELCRIP